MSTDTKTKLLELLKKHREEKALTAKSSIAQVCEDVAQVDLPSPIPDPKSSGLQIYDKYGNLITLNSAQSEFVSIASSGKSSVLIGAAGTGKTTCQKAVVQGLIQSGRAGILVAEGHKYLQSNTPGIVICAYTRRAVSNIRKNMPKDLQNNCITIHKLLEYQPDTEEIIDPVSGETRFKMVFRPNRNENNPLPSSIHTIIFEEASMLGTDLYNEVVAACPHAPQEIFLGDIQQLPPVFGKAVLGFKLLELPVVELTEVYRQALESPIISLAHRVLSGKEMKVDEFASWKKENQLTIHPWKKKVHWEEALATAGLFFTKAIENKIYDPEEDMILIPFNKSFGTDELNKIIANFLARQRGAETFEIIAGFNKHYLSVGDRVLYDKEDAIVIAIEDNLGYTGKPPQPSSIHLDYWGCNQKPSANQTDEHHVISEDKVDFLLAAVASADSEDRVRKCSHTIHLKMLDSEVTIKIDTASAVNNLMLSYVLTVHKSQGSEWRKVFVVFHNSHATMLQRELLYTAFTRAREELYIICEPDSLAKGISSQRIIGNTLAEKAEYFKGKLEKLA